MLTWRMFSRNRLVALSIGLLSVTTGADAADTERQTSPRRAFWSSLLIPGLGQLNAGASSSGVRFFAADVALWAGFFGLQRLSNVRREHYRTFAADHAGARPQGKNRQYFDDLGFYDSRLEHNQFARREDGAVAQLYADGTEFDWQWEDEVSRRQYRILRNDSESAGRQALFTTGLMVVNHLAAAIHAVRIARQAKVSAAGTGPDSAAGDTRSALFDLELVGLPDGLELMLRRPF